MDTAVTYSQLYLINSSISCLINFYIVIIVSYNKLSCSITIIIVVIIARLQFQLKSYQHLALRFLPSSPSFDFSPETIDIPDEFVILRIHG